MESLEVRGKCETQAAEASGVRSGHICENGKLVCLLSCPYLSSRFHS